jgi:hypothetical protein
MAEVSGDVSGAAVANGPKSGGGQGLQRTAAGRGGGLWDVKRAYHIISHCVKPQQRKLFCIGKEGQTSRYIIR